MTTPSASPADAVGLSPQQCVRLLNDHRRYWIVPTIACAILATAYALVMSRQWEASQALVVRREATTSSPNRPGKFADLHEMRTFQETILELAKSQQVIAATLRAVGQAEGGDAPGEPSRRDIAAFRKRLSMSPPGGAEFGKTEVFYLSVKNANRQRAISLVAELCRQLDVRLRQLREEQAESLVIELQQQVDLSSRAHDEQTGRLTEFEAAVGADLGELRMLNASFSGQSDLRQQAIALEAASREADQQVRTAEQLAEVLQKAHLDPQQLIALPSSLLASQPTLRQLKDGLVAAQVRAARLSGTRTPEHPLVQAAWHAEKKSRQDLHDELQVALKGVEVELALSRDRLASLQRQSADLQLRLGHLAELRARYENRVSAAENSRLVLDQARKQLGEVRAAQAAAQNVSLLSPIDRPETGPNPVGISRASVMLIGTLGGLMLGLGWVFLTVTPPHPSPANATSAAPGAQPPAVVRPSTVERAAQAAEQMAKDPRAGLARQSSGAPGEDERRPRIDIPFTRLSAAAGPSANVAEIMAAASPQAARNGTNSLPTSGSRFPG